MTNVSDANLNEPVARHMRTNPARLRGDQTVAEAMTAIRQSPPPARIVYFYVVNQDERLQGVIPVRALLLSPPESRIADIMLRHVIALPLDATVLDACEFFVLHRLLAFPVVDDQRRLVGAIDVELYTDELSGLGNEESDDLFQLIGVHLARAKQMNTVGAFRARFPWLLCNITGGIASAFLCGLFEEQLQRAVALALFIPVVLALAESVSIQSVSLAVQVLRSGRPTTRQIFRKLRSESTIGLLLGAASGMAVGLTALAWLGQIRLAACILVGIAAGVTAAALLGVIIPNLLHRSRLDPHLAAGPVALALTDILTLLCYFNAARWLIG